MSLTAAEAFAEGLKYADGEGSAQSLTRAKSLLRLLDLNATRFDDDTARAFTQEVYRMYFSSNSGGFVFAKYFKRALEEERIVWGPITKPIRATLTQISVIMCENLESAHQFGHIANSSLEIAYWLAQRIESDHRMEANRLMRTCGKCMSGTFVDAFFWQHYAADPVRCPVLLRPFAEGMLAREGTVAVLAKHLNEAGRTMEVSGQAVKEYRKRQETRRTGQTRRAQNQADSGA